jgi:acetyl esterase/lipase
MDAQVLSTREAMALPSRPADHRIAWGTDPVQFGDLRLPAGPGPHPVVVLIHGGCWLAEYDLAYMGALADALKDAGIATWNIEYRRVGDAGGGWPGTMLDAGQAIDHLRTLAATHSLDLDRVVLSGHSAGGHLALWAATRPRAATSNPLRGPDPLAVRGVVAIAPVADLAASVSDATPICGRSAVQLLGGTPDEVPDRYEVARPRLDAGPTMVSVVGTNDTIVPPPFSADPTRPGAIEVVEIDGADHFDLIDPTHEAWAAVIRLLT